jgi:hypothetical protein
MAKPGENTPNCPTCGQRTFAGYCGDLACIRIRNESRAVRRGAKVNGKPVSGKRRRKKLVKGL